MRSSYKKIGSFVKQVNVRNKDLSVTNLQGININKFFMPSVANTNGTDLSKYKVVAQKQFAFNPMHVGRDEVLPISMLEEEDSVIVSPAYVVFKVKDETQLLPEYLMMWCRRPEFDRNAWFTTDSSVRGGFSWKDFCDLTLPVPTIEKQREIVREYHTIVDRIKLNEQLNQKLEETAQAIYKQWFVDFEFPMSKEHAAEIGKPELEGKPYKSSGGKMVWNDELDQEIPEGWEYGTLKDLASYSAKRISVSSLDLTTYISTENMLPSRGGITTATALPNAKTVAQFEPGDILISNIRPYFKKICCAEFEGGCSNDVLCITPNSNFCHFYLYQILAKDSFFDYVMNGSKGTKMPRGDKTWIMNYPVLIPNQDITLSFKKIAELSGRSSTTRRGEMVSLLILSSLLLSKMTKAEATA